MKKKCMFSMKPLSIKLFQNDNSQKPFLGLLLLVFIVCMVISGCQAEHLTETPVIHAIDIEPTIEMQLTATLISTHEVQETITSTSTPEVQSGLCQEEQPLQAYTIVEPGTKVEMLWEAHFTPMQIRSSPDGRLLAVTMKGDTIYELKGDDVLEEAFRCPGVKIIAFAASSDGALWFTTHEGGRLYRVDPNGKIEIIAKNENPYIEPGPDGSIYALGNGLIRIEPDGTQILISDKPRGHKFSVRSNGDTAVKNSDGTIFLYSLSGESVELASGYGVDEWVTFGPDGNLYVTGWRGIDVIDIDSGSVSFITGSNDIMLTESGIFTQDGKMVFYHPSAHVYIVDLEKMTSDIFYFVKANSWAMAFNPGDSAYIAWGKQMVPETTIYRITNEKHLEKILSVPYGFEYEMAFDYKGNGYLAVADSEKDRVILQFNPQNGNYEVYAQTACSPASMTVQRSSNQVWWEECNNLVTLDASGDKKIIEGPEGGQHSYFAITSADEFYAVTFFPRDAETMPEDHRLFVLNENKTWIEIVDLTSPNPDIGHSRPVVCSNDTIYIVEKLGVESLPPDKLGLTHAAVRRLEKDGTLTLIGYDFSFDPQVVDCDIETNQIMFATGIGVFGVTPP